MTGYVYIVDYGLDKECRSIVKIGLTKNPKSRLAQLKRCFNLILSCSFLNQSSAVASLTCLDLSLLLEQKNHRFTRALAAPHWKGTQLKQFGYVPRPEPLVVGLSWC